MTRLHPGQKAPVFVCKDEQGANIRLEDFKGKKNVLLVFYPGDDTPGCTKQLCALRDDIGKFEKKDTVCFGINPQGAESNQRFIEKFKFPFHLLIDEKKQVCKAYGIGTLPFTKRTVVIIKKDGTIGYYEQGMPSDEELLEAIDSFS